MLNGDQHRKTLISPLMVRRLTAFFVAQFLYKYAMWCIWSPGSLWSPWFVICSTLYILHFYCAYLISFWVFKYFIFLLNTVLLNWNWLQLEEIGRHSLSPLWLPWLHLCAGYAWVYSNPLLSCCLLATKINWHSGISLRVLRKSYARGETGLGKEMGLVAQQPPWRNGRK